MVDLSNLQARLEETLDRHHVTGASVAVYHRGAFKAASAGVANVTTGVEVTQETVMHIGSIAKIFTTTLIMQLVEEGRLDLEERLTRYLPELKLKDEKALRQITVKMLLNHTCGIDGDVQPDHGHDEETIEKAIARFAAVGQIHDPGTECSYCNGGFVIAGYLAQRLRGRSWYELVRERIYQPLGMHHAVTLPEEALLYRASVGHYWDARTARQTRTSFALLPLSFSPGGTTLMMSAADLVIFARAHLANGLGPNGRRILLQQSTRAMREQTVRRGMHSNMGFGLGWQVLNDGVLGHGGGAPGVCSMLYIHPGKDFAAAVLTNSEHGRTLVDDLAAPWFEELIGRRLSDTYENEILPGSSESRQRIDLHRYVGTYENRLLRYVISALPQERGLGMTTCFKFRLYDSSKTELSPVIPLHPVGEDVFLVEPENAQTGAALSSGPSIRIAFKTRDAHGRMQYLSERDGRPEGRLLRRND